MRWALDQVDYRSSRRDLRWHCTLQVQAACGVLYRVRLETVRGPKGRELGNQRPERRSAPYLATYRLGDLHGRQREILTGAPTPVRTCSTYNFKDALRAPGRGWPPFMQSAPRDGGADCEGRWVRPKLAGHQGNRGAPGAGCRPLARRAASAPARTHPRGRRTGCSPQRQRWRAVLQTGPSLRRPYSEALRAHGQERSLRSRRCAIPSGLWTAPTQGFRGACRRDGQDRALPHPVAAICSNRPSLSQLITGHWSKKVHVTHHADPIGRAF